NTPVPPPPPTNTPVPPPPPTNTPVPPPPPTNTPVPPPYEVPASLIQDLLSYQAEPHGHDHVNRWTRALAGLGHGSHSNPMTLAEAEQMAQIHNPNRWNPVVEAMKKLQG
ncbi:MAG: hypothetical protein OXI77_19135, partial [Chloroflexota bacterium]|nr:hypothetical protein [Chloroflexota bacterium]